MNDKDCGFGISFCYTVDGEDKETRAYASVYGRWLTIEHRGPLTWENVQEIKTRAFGPEAACIEVYPPEQELINNVEMRHLWLLGEDDFYPNLAAEGAMKAPKLRIGELEQWFFEHWGDQTKGPENEEDALVRFLAVLRDVHPDMCSLFLEGQCYNLWRLIRVNHPKAVCLYSPTEGHVYIKLNDSFYDIRGRVHLVPHDLEELDHQRGDKPHRWGKRDGRRLVSMFS